MFSGPVDVLAQALKAECDKEGITCIVESYDKLVDESHDMTLDQPYETILHKAKNQEYDGGHAGFPCGSFSRARLNAKGDGPGPVRSGSEIYGLASNNRRQQAEADRGTVLAVRSALVIAEIVTEQRKRAVAYRGNFGKPAWFRDQRGGTSVGIA